MADQSSGIEWSDDEVPVSRRFADPYFSKQNGLDETRHVFLAGNGLPTRFRDGFHIAELGFGTGLNLLASWQAWRAADIPGRLHFTSFELYPLARADMTRALAAFPDLAELAQQFFGAWRGPGHGLELHDLQFNLILGDARQTLGNWQGRADCWFLDGFAPASNPELWEPALMQEVAAHTAPHGTAATYSAAGAVRRALADVGFGVERIPGFGRKRHMTRAVLQDAPT